MTVLEPMTYDTYGGVRDVNKKEWGDVKYIMELNRFNNQIVEYKQNILFAIYRQYYSKYLHAYDDLLLFNYFYIVQQLKAHSVARVLGFKCLTLSFTSRVIPGKLLSLSGCKFNWTYNHKIQLLLLKCLEQCATQLHLCKLLQNTFHKRDCQKQAYKYC